MSLRERVALEIGRCQALLPSSNVGYTEEGIFNLSELLRDVLEALP